MRGANGGDTRDAVSRAEENCLRADSSQSVRIAALLDRALPIPNAVREEAISCLTSRQVVGDESLNGIC